jgi:hypothetical protein
MPGGVIGREPATEGVPDEMDAANRQLSQRLVQPVRLFGGIADRSDLDALAGVAQSIEGIGSAGGGEIGNVVRPHRDARGPTG